MYGRLTNVLNFKYYLNLKVKIEIYFVVYFLLNDFIRTILNNTKKSFNCRANFGPYSFFGPFKFWSYKKKVRPLKPKDQYYKPVCLGNICTFPYDFCLNKQLFIVLVKFCIKVFFFFWKIINCNWKCMSNNNTHFLLKI